MVRNKAVHLLSMIMLLAALLCPSVSKGQEEPLSRTASEKLITRIDFRSWMSDFLTISPDSRHVTCAVRSGSKRFVILDGEAGAHYDGIGNLIFSPDSQHVAYVAKAGSKAVVVVDEEAGKKYDSFERFSPVFSPDSKRVAYGVKMGDRWAVVVDGEESKFYDVIRTPVFSPDSKRVAYKAGPGGRKWLVVMDGKEGKRYDAVGDAGAPIMFSPDSKRVAHSARTGSKWFVVLDGKEGKKYDGILRITSIFSPDGQRTAYSVKDGDKYLVVVDGQEGKRYNNIRVPVFSPDSKRVAYFAKDSSNWFVVVDGREGKKYDGVGEGSLLFSPDGKRLAYTAVVSNRTFVVVDGEEEEKYDLIGEGTLRFSPDSRRLAYAASVGGKWFVVADGKAGKPYDVIGEGDPVFSSDSKWIAYAARIGDRWLVVTDGKEGKLYDGIGPGTPFFSPDSRRVVYDAELNERQFVVVDETEGKHYSSISVTGSGSIILDSPDNLHYIAVELNGDIYLVEERVKGKTKQEELTAEALEKAIVGDSAPMVLIPAGEFQMGSDDHSDNEKPMHTVYLDAFYIDKYEVTNSQYKKFVDATEHKAPRYWDNPGLNAPNHPVAGVSWQDAMSYCEWAGKRLPTEAEWEKTARGGLIGKTYPWDGNLTRDNANYDGIGGQDEWKYTAPVGSFPPNGYGLFDMAGNVYEWCADWYGEHYYAASPRENPTGPSSGTTRVMRGGSWRNASKGLCVAFRNDSDPASATKDFCGFRCAR